MQLYYYLTLHRGKVIISNDNTDIDDVNVDCVFLSRIVELRISEYG